MFRLITKGIANISLASQGSINRGLSVSAAVAQKQQTASKKKKKPAKKPTKASKSAAPGRRPVKKAKKPESKKAIREKQLNQKRPLVQPPKKPVSGGYSLYTKEAWEKVDKATLGKDGMIPKAREIAQQWNQKLSEMEKQQYRDQAMALLEDHAKILRQWWSTVDPQLVELENSRRRRHNKQPSSVKKLTLLKDPRKPKRPLTAFMLFKNEHAEPASSIMEMAGQMKAIGAQWQSMSAESKAPYVQGAMEAQIQYKSAMKKYQQH